MEISLNKYKSKKGVDTHVTIGVDMKGEKRLVPIEPIISTLNELEEYDVERQASTTLRLVCKVATVCSNVLHNMVTEIVSDEGSSSVTCYNFGGSPNKSDLIGRDSLPFEEMLDDTQMTSLANCTYHCGFDILSNHILRCKNFKTVVAPFSTTTRDNFNTIQDYLYSFHSLNRPVTEYVWGSDGMQPLQETHLYNADDIMTFQESIEKNRIVSDGWVGFINKSSFYTSTHASNDDNEIPNEAFRKVINNRSACDFIDFYPERDLFSFAPKYNPYYHRIEKNWNYCITYPYSSTTENIAFIRKETNSVHCILNDVGYAYNGVKSITFISVPKHGLSVGHIVNIYLDNTILINLSKVIEVIDEYTFVCYNDGVEIDSSWEKGQFSYKRCINGREVKYYVRLFKKLPNYERLTNDGSETYEFQNSINKLGFSKSIYNDDVAEVVFTDNIDYGVVKDNLGRPISELYLTIVKNNKGYREWYNKENWNNGILESSYAKDVEYSHCFGKVNCAFNLSTYANDEEYVSVTKIHNVDTASSDPIYGLPTAELNATDGEQRIGEFDSIEFNPQGGYGGDNVFYGDLCCYSDLLCEEQSIQMVDFRFNTYQRESSALSDAGWNIKYNEIKSDDFDGGLFSVSPQPPIDIIKKEGYYYKPHYKIPIRTFSQSISQNYGLRLTVKTNGWKKIGDGKYDISIMENGLISTSMDVRVLSLSQEKIYYGSSTDIELVTSKRFHSVFKDEDGNNLIIDDPSMFVLFIKPIDVPDYASFSYDASCMFFWRDIIQNGYDISNSIESYPFTNGSLYALSDITLYLKRQDADLSNGLYEGGLYADIPTSIMKDTEKDNYISEEDIEC